MKFAVDLHIHSALSPCASEDMTPNNIVNMAVLKGLDIISVTDHNSTFNLPSIYKLSIQKGIMLLPGVEVQTKEEIHVLCYFKHIENAIKIGNILYDRLPDIKNDEKLFGEQLILNEEDGIIKHVDKLLLSSTDISIKELVSLVSSMEGVCIPAHIDRDAYSIIYNLGFIPQDLNLSSVEISKNANASDVQNKYPDTKKYRVIRNSDAHYLWDISERKNFIDLPCMSLSSILSYLKCI